MTFDLRRIGRLAIAVPVGHQDVYPRPILWAFGAKDRTIQLLDLALHVTARLVLGSLKEVNEPMCRIEDAHAFEVVDRKLWHGDLRVNHPTIASAYASARDGSFSLVITVRVDSKISGHRLCVRASGSQMVQDLRTGRIRFPCLDQRIERLRGIAQPLPEMSRDLNQDPRTLGAVGCLIEGRQQCLDLRCYLVRRIEAFI